MLEFIQLVLDFIQLILDFIQLVLGTVVVDILACTSRLCNASRYLSVDGASSSGKPQVFGTCIRRFESSRPSLLDPSPASLPQRGGFRDANCLACKVANHEGLATLHRACESPAGAGYLPVSGH